MVATKELMSLPVLFFPLLFLSETQFNCCDMFLQLVASVSGFLVVTYELMLLPEICISSKSLCCDLKFSHHNFIHFYPGCDLDSLLRPRKFLGLLEQFNFQQVQFSKSNQNKYNSIHIHHSNIHQIHSSMHQIQN